MSKVQNVQLKVVGVTFTNENTGVSRQEVIKMIREKGLVTEVSLVREPTNKFDKNAIMVMSEFGQAGYIGKDYAAIIAGMMDSGRKFNTTVAEVNEYKNTKYLHITINEVE